jgi:hypothetical protein
MPSQGLKRQMVSKHALRAWQYEESSRREPNCEEPGPWAGSHVGFDHGEPHRQVLGCERARCQQELRYWFRMRYRLRALSSGPRPRSSLRIAVLAVAEYCRGGSEQETRDDFDAQGAYRSAYSERSIPRGVEWVRKADE